MNTLAVLTLFPILYILSVDQNVVDYLYLRIFRELPVRVAGEMLKFRLLFSLKWDRFLMSRGRIPSKYYKMAEEVRGDR